MDELFKSLKDALLQTYSKSDLELIERAYQFSALAHEGQKRLTGVPFITHAAGVGILLAQWKLPPTIVAAGLLHDIPEDTKYTVADIETKFGGDIAQIVEGETKLDRLTYHGVERYAENLRKMFLAMAQDVRVIFVKFADRIHNLSTLEGVPEYKQQRIARESLEIYAPIANRLGMGAIRGELEDLSFKYLYPKDYDWVTELIKDRAHKKEEYLDEIKKIVEKRFKQEHINPLSVHGRVKRLYSLHRKLLEKDRDINKVYDLVALRIIVPTVQDCYAALGIIHQQWSPLKGRIKDYIAQPKPNGYQSIHTTVFCKDGEIVEFQIRTEQMHEEAEFGIAAHWFYTEQGKKSVKTDQHIRWLKELAEVQKNIQDRKKFLEALDSLKIDFFHNRIFVFTPRGDVIDLPDGSTPVDFAYAIHTEIGHHCTGVRVNDQMSPLNSVLQSEDVVEIITDKNRKSPSSDWVNFVKTAHARDKIKESLRKTKLSGFLKIKKLIRKPR
ncbi:bifunctional (p)ppGpp synthetase/guanosine-3',5'-bis(diphosphate) 3'-pyrophosphohydrolase [Candidatus Uhrbacteria bacterium]|nr:bifunctional (p)ppGpp synthetase/guanosine-3',5'-bis(diphosphate) 3'-pyrophosphohydrolase [Candidatus Uhrbacteria bacterium]